jgi:hypothetical protein
MKPRKSQLIDRDSAADSPKALDLKKMLYLNYPSLRHGFMILKFQERPVSPRRNSKPGLVHFDECR